MSVNGVADSNSAQQILRCRLRPGSLRHENRPRSQALLTYVVRVIAERLNFASKTIGVLRR
jgi:hypothetical protein